MFAAVAHSRDGLHLHYSFLQRACYFGFCSSLSLLARIRILVESPVVVIPRNETSQERFEIKLGELHFSNDLKEKCPFSEVGREKYQLFSIFFIDASDAPPDVAFSLVSRGVLLYMCVCFGCGNVIIARECMSDPFVNEWVGPNHCLSCICCWHRQCHPQSHRAGSTNTCFNCRILASCRISTQK